MEKIVPFNIDRAKDGMEIRTSKGDKAQFVALVNNKRYPVIAIITDDEGSECVESYTLDGYINSDKQNRPKDLVIVESMEETWIGVYRNQSTGKVFSGIREDSSKEEVEKDNSKDSEHVINAQ